MGFRAVFANAWASARKRVAILQAVAAAKGLRVVTGNRVALIENCNSRGHFVCRESEQIRWGSIVSHVIFCKSLYLQNFLRN